MRTAKATRDIGMVVEDATTLVVTSAQLRAARAYLDWTMEQAARAAGIAKRTVIRLERDERYAAGGPVSLGQLVAAYRAQSIALERGGVVPLGGGARARRRGLER